LGVVLFLSLSLSLPVSLSFRPRFYSLSLPHLIGARIHYFTRNEGYAFLSHSLSCFSVVPRSFSHLSNLFSLSLSLPCRNVNCMKRGEERERERGDEETHVTTTTAKVVFNSLCCHHYSVYSLSLSPYSKKTATLYNFKLRTTTPSTITITTTEEEQFSSCSAVFFPASLHSFQSLRETNVSFPKLI